MFEGEFVGNIFDFLSLLSEEGELLEELFELMDGFGCFG